MTFLNSAFLWTLPFVSAPIILHFFFRQPPQKISFSHIAWLRDVHARLIPRRRLTHLLLLIVRTLLILFLILFFARPVLRQTGPFTHSSEKSSVIIVFDCSASMGAIVNGRSGFDLARDHVKSFLRKMAPSVNVGIVAYTTHVESEAAPTVDRSKILSQLDHLSVRRRPTNCAPALESAYAMLFNQPAGKKTILIVSDQARHGWETALSKNGQWDKYDPEIEIIFWDMLPNMSNAGVSEASLMLTGEGQLKGHWTFHNPLRKNVASLWRLTLNGKNSDQGSVYTLSQRKNELSMQALVPNGGYYSGQIELTPDAWSVDDIFYLAGRVPKGYRLLVVDGESGLAPSDSESYYVRLALESPRDPRLESIKLIRPDLLSHETLGDYNAIVLANVGLHPGDVNALMSWVENGGGLFLSAGRNWRSAKDLPYFSAVSFSPMAGPVSLSPPSDGQFLSKLFPKAEPFEWNQIHVNNHLRLLRDDATDVLWSMENGDPLLVRTSRGKGTVLCLTTSINRSWSNFPVKPLFAPLVRELIASLADPLRDQESLNGLVDQPIRFRVPPRTVPVSIVSPDGTAAPARMNRDGLIEFSNTGMPGLYTVKTASPDTDFSFAINMPDLDREGDFEPLSESDAKRIFPKARVEHVAFSANGDEKLLSIFQGVDVAQFFLMLIILCFLVETALTKPWKKTVRATAFVVLIGWPISSPAADGNQFVYTQLKYDGAWDPYPSSHEPILDMLHRMTNIPFVHERRVVTLDDPGLFESPFLLVKGNADVHFSESEKRHLKEYIDRGGFVFFDDTLADAHSAFGSSLHQLFADMYPGRSLEPLPMDHALYRSFFLLRQTAGRRMASRNFEGLDVDANGRTAVIYSPNDLLGAWLKDPLGAYAFTCEPGGETQRWESFKLTVNIIYFSLTGTYKKDAIHQPFIERKLGS